MITFQLIPIITEDGARWEQIIIIGKPEPIRVKMNDKMTYKHDGTHVYYIIK